ncbi:hypothetical protein HA151_06925 [Prochlorococcus marinus XMU1419]|uniref:polysaccharide deacetylase WbmS family protein n=1 Tax=Prochlorococcus marinus TaxID=1219 RepID=UPI001ADBF7C8|nr:hypothetical protein [Prochlorococcus marinus]MBO8234247.1 hypothetical protein [Prochlorococcus marinus XMU1419]MBW3075937.1 hypothetical protein [Prochlorococcus marinus str. XMU1419]
MIEFEKISNIKFSNKDSWASKIFLSFDIDWAHDLIVEDTINLIFGVSKDIKATWFITHQSKILEKLRKNKNFELGIHPNFNNLLLNKSSTNIDQSTILREIINIVPEAKSVRSHSMMQSSRLLDLFKKYGLRYDVNHFIPNFVEANLKPFKHWNGICKVPYCWEDDIHIAYQDENIIEMSPSEIANDKNIFNLKVFDFHPIHIFLNTESLKRYEESRSLHDNPKELIKYRYKGYGTRDRFLDLINLIAK